MPKTKIFVSAYACEPDKGSEPGVGWNWTLQMARYFELWVLTRANNKNAIEDYYKKNHLLSQIHYVYYDVPSKYTFWKNKNTGVHIYYWLWQRNADKIIKKIMLQEDIKIFHQLTFGSALFPTSRYGSSTKFVWGPVGGLVTIPWDFFKHYTFRGKCIEMMRYIMNFIVKYSTTFKKNCKHANLIICKDKSTYNRLPLKKNAIILTDVAIDNNEEDNFLTNSVNVNSPITTYLTVGKLEEWRGFDVLIEAFYHVVKINHAVRLKIIGDGYCLAKLKSLVRTLNLENYVIFYGNISMNNYITAMKNTDIVVNPCLKEGAVTISFDAIKYKKPLISIDTGGYTNTLRKCSYLINRYNREQVINDLSSAMIKLYNKNIRDKIITSINEMGDSLSWREKGNTIIKLYEKYVEND
jgi:glycosyltransferase involved in cell wall biosynthesis